MKHTKEIYGGGYYYRENHAALIFGITGFFEIQSWGRLESWGRLDCRNGAF
jgi:hypothetical protein